MASTKDSAVVLGRYSNICVIGAGVIGASWTALFLAHGLNVVVNDLQPDIETMVKAALLKIAPTLHALGLPHQSLDRNLRFETDLDRAVATADLVQENGPERPEWKQQLWARIEPVVPKHALLLSSSSARPATEQGREMKDASRLLVGHPFNPPHLIPLVEVVPGERTDPKAVEEALAFYEALGKVPRVLKKEIQGFVANRLQRAIMREACYLVQEGVVTVDELDDIVTSSIGLRWAVNGPFSSFHMGGGPKGLESFFQHLGKNMAASFKVIPSVELDEKLQRRIVEQAAASFGRTPIPEMERKRDDAQVALLRTLSSLPAPDGESRL
ncbi:MAG TPA: 3-hydroxyacyl-CoA dehydrogenase NAD-binding domain-containing protein [Bradyrhizobium sp.]|jgi:ketoreductase RED1|uniref:3-hydroxyacyl-CoA dehydrogenase NAD-binding domain-containing protein n=1 Tax=Bradyrhizobium sp. TaxID=376 RepID=UPI002C00BCCF|nr:3-hydroxyacyl-CoA dehydrogenase NAD-binding domain-containing protein [Bradyrhizobium sp.]HXB79215.1 3-hydroxyacyl-CoA dehydrogenase NAD-binding domain-containing protein [Bradyrhizobium sp.]